jgi:pimeloyl-ACP methyl ester carboxylesterase
MDAPKTTGLTGRCAEQLDAGDSPTSKKLKQQYHATGLPRYTMRLGHAQELQFEAKEATAKNHNGEVAPSAKHAGNATWIRHNTKRYNSWFQQICSFNVLKLQPGPMDHFSKAVLPSLQSKTDGCELDLDITTVKRLTKTGPEDRAAIDIRCDEIGLRAELHFVLDADLGARRPVLYFDGVQGPRGIGSVQSCVKNMRGGVAKNMVVAGKLAALAAKWVDEELQALLHKQGGKLGGWSVYPQLALCGVSMGGMLTFYAAADCAVNHKLYLEHFSINGLLLGDAGGELYDEAACDANFCMGLAMKNEGDWVAKGLPFVFKTDTRGIVVNMPQGTHAGGSMTDFSPGTVYKKLQEEDWSLVRADLDRFAAFMKPSTKANLQKWTGASDGELHAFQGRMFRFAHTMPKVADKPLRLDEDERALVVSFAEKWRDACEKDRDLPAKFGWGLAINHMAERVLFAEYNKPGEAISSASSPVKASARVQKNPTLTSISATPTITSTLDAHASSTPPGMPLNSSESS